MARIRTIKPEFWEDEELCALPIQARLLYIGTWNFADDNGVLLTSIKWIKSKVFPFDDTLREQQILEWLKLLVDARMLIPFIFENKGYYKIRTFHDHQLIDKRYCRHIVPVEDVDQILSNLTVEENTTCSPRVHHVFTSLERKGSVNVKGSVKEVVAFAPKTIDDRITDFMNSCSPFVGEYSKETVRAFFDYWSEKNNSGKKMKWELQQTFEISKRLSTWKRKEKDFTVGAKPIVSRMQILKDEGDLAEEVLRQKYANE